MCTLSRLNRRMKHLLFRTLLQQEVHFFEKNDPGEMNTLYRDDLSFLSGIRCSHGRFSSKGIFFCLEVSGLQPLAAGVHHLWF